VTTLGRFSCLKTGIQVKGQSTWISSTKHVDIKYHYIREQIDVGLIEVKLVKSEEYLADLFTKTLKGDVLEYHVSKLVYG
jgi:hypothetical protein